jgi:hypothetical protein
MKNCSQNYENYRYSGCNSVCEGGKMVLLTCAVVVRVRACACLCACVHMFVMGWVRACVRVFVYVHARC